MVGEKLNRSQWILLLNDLEEFRHRMGIIPRRIEHIGPDLIRLGFGGAGILEQQGLDAHSQSELSQPLGAAVILPEDSFQEGQTTLRQDSLRGNVGSVPHHHVPFLVRDHAGE